MISIARRGPIVYMILCLMIFSSAVSDATNVASQTKEERLVSDPQKIDFGIIGNYEIRTERITITHAGPRGSKWVARAADPWLTLDTRGGVLDGDPMHLTVTMNAGALQSGKHTSQITVASAAGTLSIPVYVQLLTENESTASRTLKSLVITSETEFLSVGKKLFFRARGEYADGSFRDITKDVKWISTDSQIGEFIGPGTLQGVSVGDIRVYAVSGGLRSSEIVVSVEEREGPVLWVSPTESVLGNIEKDTQKDIAVKLRNRGAGELTWEAVSLSPWLSVRSALIADEDEIWGVPVRQERMTGSGSTEITITVNTEDMEEGEHEGEVLIKSNGGEEKISISMHVVTLKSLSISPVSIKIGAGQKRKFRVIGIWSDGSRTDLSAPSEGEWVISDPLIGSFPRKRSVFRAEGTGRVELFRIRGNMVSNSAVVNVEEFISRPVLLVSPREVDLGAIGAGEHGRGDVLLKNVGSGKLYWWTEGPETWRQPGGGYLEGTIDADQRYSRLSVETEIAKEEKASTRVGRYPVTIKIGHDDRFISFARDLAPGRYRERFAVTSSGGTRHIFVTFTVAETSSRPHLEFAPPGLDFGTIEAGKQVMKKIEIRNTGKDVLTWRARLQGNRRLFQGKELVRGRYVSLFNGDMAGPGPYEVPRHLMRDITMTGNWYNAGGYPVSEGPGDDLSYTFTGTGIALFVAKTKEGGTIDVRIDDSGSMAFDCSADQRERGEFVIATKLDEGEHRLTVKNRGGRLELEGVRIYSDRLITRRSGWIRIFPDSGTTTGEVDYINVMINSKGLMPGSYSEHILFYSDGGNGYVELALDVEDRAESQLIAIYRQSRGDDTLLTADPEPVQGYRREKGTAFSIFRKGTPGTSPFYGWYNPQRGDHFYSSNKTGGGKDLAGYEFEGSLGNIATLKLSGTRELFRWYNADAGTHFYTTDPKGEGRTDDGYTYDGIAGYVR